MFENIKSRIFASDTLIKLIGINVLVFLVVSIIHIPQVLMGFNDSLGGLYKSVYWLSLPSDLSLLLLRPWSILTHMFLHQDFFHILFNMFMLYFSGRIFADLLGAARLTPLYILGGLCGAALFIVGYQLLPGLAGGGGLALGASGAVMAVFVATATYFPTYQVFLFGIIRIQLGWLAFFYVVADFVALGGITNIGGHLAHLGGALFGFIYAKQLAAGKDITSMFQNISFSLKKPRYNTKMKVTHSGDAPERKKHDQKSVDAILDKISQSGYDSLSKSEKETLFKASKE